MPTPTGSDAPVVLLVDDEPAVTSTFRRLMAHLPWRVLEANSPQEALEIVAREDIDVVLTDEQMPGMSGTELLARIRKVRPRAARMILTGHASVASTLRAINEGEIRRYFLKPCDASTVISDLQAAVIERRQVRERGAAARPEEQEALRQALEQCHPGITRLRRDPDGVIDLDGDDPIDADDDGCGESGEAAQ